MLTSREPWIDALRVLAVLGVFVVNGLGYAFAPAYPLQIGPPQPLDSTAALAAHGFAMLLFMGKAWPLLSFLFGYSVCSMAIKAHAQGLNSKTVLLKRHSKLLLLGALHGALLFFGDILTTYALAGFLLARWALLRPARLLKIWRRVTVVVVLLCALYAASALFTWFPAANAPASLDYWRIERFGNLSAIERFFELNSSSFAWQQLNSVIGFLPFVLWAGIAGVLARRFGLLGFGRFAVRFWRSHLGAVQLALAGLCNFGLAALSVQLHAQAGYSDRAVAIATLSSMLGMWLTAACLAWAMRQLHRERKMPRWALWLAPAGRHTLLMYLGLSLGLVASGGAFLNVLLGTWPLLACLTAAWAAAVLLARAATKRGWRDPIAAWLSR